MKKLMFVFMITFATLLFSCNESTVNPNDTKEQKEINLTKNVWVFSSSSNSKNPLAIKMQFRKDRKFYNLTQNHWANGTWNIDYDKNKIILNVLTASDTISLISVNESKLVIKKIIDGEMTELTYIPEVITMQNMTITGNITFDKSITDRDLTDAKICIVWHTPNTDESLTIFEIGTIDSANKTFSIQLNNNIPLSLFMISNSKINGYFNVGYICLIWEKNLYNGQVVSGDYLYDLPQLGCVEDRAILYVNGDYKNWNVDFLFGDFAQGFNFCSGWYTSQLGENDKWQVDETQAQLLLKVVPNSKINAFKFPDWQ